MQSLAKSGGPLMVAIWALLLAAALAAVAATRWDIAFVSLATLGLSLLPPLVAARWSLSLPLPFLLATTIFIFASVFMGEALDFYERVWWWELVLHGTAAIGLGLTGFLFVFMLFEGARFAAPPSALAFITFCVAMMAGAKWEVFEYAMDQLFGLNMQKSGLDDTMGDLIINAVGAVISAITGYIYVKHSYAGILGRSLTQFIQHNRRLYSKYKDRLRK